MSSQEFCKPCVNKTYTLCWHLSITNLLTYSILNLYQQDLSQEKPILVKATILWNKRLLISGKQAKIEKTALIGDLGEGGDDCHLLHVCVHMGIFSYPMPTSVAICRSRIQSGRKQNPWCSKINQFLKNQKLELDGKLRIVPWMGESLHIEALGSKTGKRSPSWQCP